MLTSSVRRVTIAHLPTPLEEMPRLAQALGGRVSSSSVTMRPVWLPAATRPASWNSSSPMRWKGETAMGHSCDVFVQRGAHDGYGWH